MRCRLKIFYWADKMVQWAKLFLCKTDNLSLILGMHTKVERESPVCTAFNSNIKEEELGGSL